MKISWPSVFAGLAAGVVIGATGAVVQFASSQTVTKVPITPSSVATPKPVRMTKRRAPKGEELEVLRISDKAFVVVKDHGDSQTTMYFDVKDGFPVLKGGAKKYNYAK